MTNVVRIKVTSELIEDLQFIIKDTPMFPAFEIIHISQPDENGIRIALFKSDYVPDDLENFYVIEVTRHTNPPMYPKREGKSYLTWTARPDYHK